jgi:hypothetical protein
MMLRKPGEYDPSKRVQVSARRKTAEGPDDVVRKLSRLPVNKKCADCSAKLPQAVNLTHGTFVCLTCSGVHREFSHRVKGIGASSFLAEEAEFLKQNGNEKVNKLYLANYNSASERLKEPDGSMSTVDGQLLREWLRRKYIDRSFMDKGYKRTGPATHTNSGPTRVHIPPKQSVSKPSVVAPAEDLLGGWDSVDAPPSATLSSNIDAEWDAFGQSRVQQNAFHADFGSQNHSNVTSFHADFSQAGASVVPSVPAAAPQEPPPPPPSDNFHADFDHFGVISPTPPSVPPEVSHSFQPDFSNFQANQPPFQMDQQSLQHTSDPLPSTAQINVDVPPLQMQQQSLQPQANHSVSSGLINPVISNSQTLQLDLPPLQLDDPSSSRTQVLQNEEVSVTQMNQSFRSEQVHQDFSGPQLQHPSVQKQQLDTSTMVSQEHLDTPTPLNHQQSIQQLEMTVDTVQGHQDVPTSQLQQLSLQSSMPIKLNESIPNHQVPQRHQQVLSQSNFSGISHDHSTIPTLNVQQVPNEATTESYEGDGFNSFRTHADENLIPSPTEGTHSSLIFSKENQMQMLESSSINPSERDGADPALKNCSMPSAMNTGGNDAFDSFGNMNMIGDASLPIVPNVISTSLGCIEHNSSSSNNGNGNDKKFHSGQTVLYKSGEIVTVTKVHLDDDLVPFYDIRFQDGKEKQTTNEHLVEADKSSKEFLMYSINRILEQLNEEQLTKTRQFLESNFK